MELGSGSFTTESGESSTSLHGLKFGQKIYFEDVGSSSSSGGNNNNNNNIIQVNNNPSGGSASGVSSSSGSGRKVRGGGGGAGGVVQTGGGGQPPRCQVEGCKVDLSDAKAYYSRHKVCSMHSKSPVVIVAGLEQRFCQQCSRFHLLPEFDQGKRSCRRRLAGHNERRRKPPPGSVLANRHGRLSSSVTENGGRGGGFLVDFSAYQGVTVRDGWPVTRVSEQVPGNQTNIITRHVPHPQWHYHSENPPTDRYLQCLTGGTSFSAPGIPSRECFTGIVDSSCALSLLSNQPWGSRSRAAGLGVGDLMQAESKSMAQPVSPRGNQYPNMSWCFKGNEAGSSSHQLLPQLGLGPSSDPVNSHFSGELELSQPSTRHYMDLEHSRDYDDSTLEMHWSL